MRKKLVLIVSLLLVVSIALTACGQTTTTPAATEEPVVEEKVKVCQITDTGGIDDKSFNATAWKGIEDAVTELGAEGKYLESKEVADYEKNLNAFIEEKCDLIVTVEIVVPQRLSADAKAALEAFAKAQSGSVKRAASQASVSRWRAGAGRVSQAASTCR